MASREYSSPLDTPRPRDEKALVEEGHVHGELWNQSQCLLASNKQARSFVWRYPHGTSRSADNRSRPKGLTERRAPEDGNCVPGLPDRASSVLNDASVRFRRANDRTIHLCNRGKRLRHRVPSVGAAGFY